MPEFTVPRLEKLGSQPEAQKLLLNFLQEPGSRTFLWTGPGGCGKRTHALALIRSLFCKEGPSCPGCAACKQVVNKTHPDLFWVHRDHFWSEDPEHRKKQGIIVEVAKRLSEKLNQAAFSAPFKVAVILDAETLNEKAQDVLLKTLEEPPAHTLIILLAERTGDFRPTVLSRCRPIRFRPLPSAEIEKILRSTYGWAPEEAAKAAQGSGGSLSRALQFADGHWAAFREKACADMDRGLLGGDEDWLALGSEYEKWEPEFLEDRERTATQRKGEVLGEALQAYLDLWSRRMSGEAPVPKGLSALPAEAVLACLQKHQDMIPANLNSRMIMDHLFLELREGFKKGELPNRPFAELSTRI